MKVKCSVCGEGLTQAAIRELSLSDPDPEFTIVEKMFQISEWWVAGEDEGAHECKVVFEL